MKKLIIGTLVTLFFGVVGFSHAVDFFPMTTLNVRVFYTEQHGDAISLSPAHVSVKISPLEEGDQQQLTDRSGLASFQFAHQLTESLRIEVFDPDHATKKLGEKIIPMPSAGSTHSEDILLKKE